MPIATPKSLSARLSAPPSYEVQLSSYSYAAGATVFGSNIQRAWHNTTGFGVTVALIDDGFDPATARLDGRFSTALSRDFSGSGSIGEPAGGFHGTTTSSLIGATGNVGGPVGIAPDATIVGVKVGFGNTPFSGFVNALNYAAGTASVINNSWGFNGYGVGEPTQAVFAPWYAAVQKAVATGRHGLGDVIVFAAGNDRAGRNDLALQPINSDPREIAVAATNANGTVASFSTAGAALLVSAIGVNVAVLLPGGTSYGFASGTSYSAPTVSAIVALMLAANPNLGWRDVQEILTDSAYAPPPSAAGFVANHARDWNGGARLFSNDLGFGVVDASVAVDLARAWTLQSTSANLLTVSVTNARAFSVAKGGTAASTLAFSAGLRIQHVQVKIDDIGLLAARTMLVLISPAGTRSVLVDQTGLVGGVDQTGRLDLNGDVITSNAFWGESAAGTWTLQVQNIGGNTVATVRDWSLTAWGDAGAIAAAPLVYTPSFSALAKAAPGRTLVTTAGTHATTIDLIDLAGPTKINLNGGAGSIDGVAVTVVAGLRNLNATGSTGSLAVTGAAGGGQITAGNGTTIITGMGHDRIIAGLGATTVSTGAGGSVVDLRASAMTSSVQSGGGDTIYAGSGAAMIRDIGLAGDVIYAGGASMTFISAAGKSTIYASIASDTISLASSGSAQLQIIFQLGQSAGLDLISGFRPGRDVLHLVGYAAPTAAASVQGQQSDGKGGSILALSDGTRINMLGIDHIAASVFV